MIATEQLSNPPDNGKKYPLALFFLKKSHKNNEG
jgi:hypothetical protein